MIKDVIVNLTVGAARDVAAEYAVSVAGAFGAHLSGIGFAYQAVLPGTLFGGVAADLLQRQRADSQKAARAAIDNFEAAVRRTGVRSRSGSWCTPAMATPFGHT